MRLRLRIARRKAVGAYLFQDDVRDGRDMTALLDIVRERFDVRCGPLDLGAPVRGEPVQH